MADSPRPRGRPLPRPQRWTVDVAAHGTVESWEEPARRLVTALGEISAAVREAYGEPVSWRSPIEEAVTWADPDAVHKLMECGSTADGVAGLVQGRLPSEESALVDVPWRAGAPGRVLECTARFNPRGGARSLARHEPDWLVALLGTVVDAVDGDTGRIVTSSWLAEDERRMRVGVPPREMVPFWLGELSFFPLRVDAEQLPESLVAHPWPTRRGMGTVVALADLTSTVTTPAKAVDALLPLRRHIAGD